MAMERNWSGDSISSPLLEKPSYIATFDANRPRHHRRRSSLPPAPHRPSASSLHPNAASASVSPSPIFASSSSRSASTQHGPSDTAANLRERRKFKDRHKLAQSAIAPSSTSASQKKRHARLNVPTSSSAARESWIAAPARKPRIVSYPSTDVAYSSTYAAGPSSAEERGYSAGQVSADDASSSDAETFQWDIKRRRSSLPPQQYLRSYLAPDNSNYGRSIARQPSPSGHRSKQHVSAPRESGPSLPCKTENPRAAESSRSRSPALRSKDLPSHTRSSTAKESGVAQDSPASATAKAGIGTRYAKATSPVARRPKTFNATIEMLLLAVTGALACWTLAQRDEAVARAKAGELGVVIALSIVYFALARRPGMIWSTDARSYRLSEDDGSMCGLMLGPLLAATMLIASLEEMPETPLRERSPNGEPLQRPLWLIEDPLPILGDRPRKGIIQLTSLSALTLSRCTLLSLQTLISLIFLVHLVATKCAQRTRRAMAQTTWGRLGSYIAFSSVLTMSLYGFRELFGRFGIPLWTGVAPWELITASVLFQTNMYSISRLGRKSFTLGELGIVAALGVTLMLEAINLTLAKLFPNSSLYVKTFRRATPLLVFQLALIVGTFCIGFLLSPLLYLSRNLAQKPVHRLRWPHKRDLHRRLLAGFFYLFSTAYILGVLGLWVRWLLDQRDPWLWTAYYMLQGKRWWSRPGLVAYWLTWIVSSIAGWQAVVARAKRFRNRQPVSANSLNRHLQPPASSLGPAPPSPRSSAWDLMGPSNATQPPATNRIGSGEPLSSLKVRKPTHLSLNARRKFFHALAVVLYTPGIAFDPAFMHLAFSLAFSIFTFAEYVRYYALFPFGASLHVFLSEFTDHKDSGPVILSHFYLLTGCCGGLWLEGNSQIMHHTGVLVLGVGDALASVIGRKYGQLHWPGSSKTVEGSLAFFFSVVVSAWVLRGIGWCQEFSLWRYSGVASMLCLMEGVSEQNDNLILPIFAFICLSLFHV